MPGVAGGTDWAGGWDEACGSQKPAGTETVSSTPPGQAGTDRGGVDASELAGISVEAPGMYPLVGGVTATRYAPPLGQAASEKFRSNL